jgi:hypothetical protein
MSAPVMEDVVKPPMAEEEFGGNKRTLLHWEALLLGFLVKRLLAWRMP